MLRAAMVSIILAIGMLLGCASDSDQADAPGSGKDSAVADTAAADTVAADTVAADTVAADTRGDDSTVDAGASDVTAPDTGPSKRVTYVADVRPILSMKCDRCHTSFPTRILFAANYSAMLGPSKLCPGKKVGACVLAALKAQYRNGSTTTNSCRTVVVTPFHRESWWCLTPAEIGVVEAWVKGGMLEK